ncbi:mucin-5AC-like isoform X3 [Branchiostoma floridae]|uniref:Mucin-5AC-like isoform X3 n=1 Tax=Branchiostoma floridae TaxID=7739 RepID=A0A9J7LS38_BRAFL|nr:mucin-5AC-like isoform X3 [Branchiostoma floridae]
MPTATETSPGSTVETITTAAPGTTEATPKLSTATSAQTEGTATRETPTLATTTATKTVELTQTRTQKISTDAKTTTPKQLTILSSTTAGLQATTQVKSTILSSTVEIQTPAATTAVTTPTESQKTISSTQTTTPIQSSMLSSTVDTTTSSATTRSQKTSRSTQTTKPSTVMSSSAQTTSTTFESTTISPSTTKQTSTVTSTEAPSTAELTLPRTSSIQTTKPIKSTVVTSTLAPTTATKTDELTQATSQRIPTSTQTTKPIESTVLSSTVSTTTLASTATKTDELTQATSQRIPTSTSTQTTKPIESTVLSSTIITTTLAPTATKTDELTQATSQRIPTSTSTQTTKPIESTVLSSTIITTTLAPTATKTNELTQVTSQRMPTSTQTTKSIESTVLSSTVLTTTLAPTTATKTDEQTQATSQRIPTSTSTHTTKPIASTVLSTTLAPTTATKTNELTQATSQRIPTSTSTQTTKPIESTVLSSTARTITLAPTTSTKTDELTQATSQRIPNSTSTQTTKPIESTVLSSTVLTTTLAPTATKTARLTSTPTSTTDGAMSTQATTLSSTMKKEETTFQTVPTAKATTVVPLETTTQFATVTSTEAATTAKTTLPSTSQSKPTSIQTTKPSTVLSSTVPKSTLAPTTATKTTGITLTTSQRNHTSIQTTKPIKSTELTSIALTSTLAPTTATKTDGITLTTSQGKPTSTQTTKPIKSTELLSTILTSTLAPTTARLISTQTTVLSSTVLTSTFAPTTAAKTAEFTPTTEQAKLTSTQTIKPIKSTDLTSTKVKTTLAPTTATKTAELTSTTEQAKLTSTQTTNSITSTEFSSTIGTSKLATTGTKTDGITLTTSQRKPTSTQTTKPIESTELTSTVLTSTLAPTTFAKTDGITLTTSQRKTTSTQTTKPIESTELTSTVLTSTLVPTTATKTVGMTTTQSKLTSTQTTKPMTSTVSSPALTTTLVSTTGTKTGTPTTSQVKPESTEETKAITSTILLSTVETTTSIPKEETTPTKGISTILSSTSEKTMPSPTTEATTINQDQSSTESQTATPIQTTSLPSTAKRKETSYATTTSTSTSARETTTPETTTESNPVTSTETPTTPELTIPTTSKTKRTSTQTTKPIVPTELMSTILTSTLAPTTATKTAELTPTTKQTKLTSTQTTKPITSTFLSSTALKTTLVPTTTTTLTTQRKLTSTQTTTPITSTVLSSTALNTTLVPTTTTALSSQRKLASTQTTKPITSPVLPSTAPTTTLVHTTGTKTITQTTSQVKSTEKTEAITSTIFLSTVETTTSIPKAETTPTKGISTILSSTSEKTMSPSLTTEATTINQDQSSTKSQTVTPIQTTTLPSTTKGKEETTHATIKTTKSTSSRTQETTTEFVPVATTEAVCTPYWTDFFNENTPTQGLNGYELETIAFLSTKYEICKDDRPIKDVQCLDAATNKTQNETGDVARCTTSEGLMCINGENLFTDDEQCEDYKVRFLCGCEESTTIQPVTTDGSCIPYWTEFFDEHTPIAGENGFEVETLEDLKTKHMICHGMLITDIDCVNGTGVPYTETGDVVFCNVTHGLRCFNHDNWFLNSTCDNYQVRFFCNCPAPTPSEPPVTTIQPTTSDQCVSHWTEFFNDHTPTEGENGFEIETLQDLREKYMICHGMLITDVECVNNAGTPFSETGKVAFCNVTHGLRCYNHDNWYMNTTCDDYKIRFYCECPTTPAPTETTKTCAFWTQFFDEHTPTVGSNGLETETLQDLKNKYLICHGLPITDVECLNDNDISYSETGDVAYCNTTDGLRCFNHDNWYTDQQCDNYKVRFYCDCPTETTTQPETTAAPSCVPHWTQFFDEHTPTVGQNGLETETLQDLKNKYLICHGQEITDVECLDNNGTSFTDTGDVAFCDVTNGLRCYNSDNWYTEDGQCEDYKVRFYCDCPETTTPEPTCAPYWTEFFDESTPTDGQNGLETETLQDLRTKYMICHGLPIIDVECVDDNGISYLETGDVAYCNTTHGLRCYNSDNWYTEDQECSNYRVRFQCGCPITPEPPCGPYWTEFFDESTPTVGQNGLETETLQDLRTRYMICHGLPITDVECLDDNDVSYLDTGDVAYCTTTDGLQCFNSDNWYTEDQQCSNYKVRFQCGCPTTPAPVCAPHWTEFFDESTPTEGQNGLETETLQDLRTKYMICHDLPITGVECVDDNDVSYLDTGDVAYCTTTDGLQCYNSDNWYTDDQQCSNYKVRFQCGCPCETYWTEFFDESTPTEGENGLEAETLQDLRTKYMICHGLPITDVECVDDNGISYLETGDVAYCTTTDGLQCYNSDNWYTEDQQCSNYRVRFQCGCPTTPDVVTGIPLTTQPLTTYPPPFGNVTKVLIHTLMEGFNYTKNMSIEGTADRLWLEEGVLSMIGQMFDDHLGVDINLTVTSVVEGSVDVTTNVDLLESLIPTAYSRIMGDEWLNTVIKDEMPPDRYEYLIGIDTARRKLDEEHGHVHTLHYAMQHCGDFIPGCYPKELCLTWENETNCRCFNGFVSRGGHDCIHIHTSTPPPERCEPYWTPFFNTNSTTDGEYGGDMELLANIRQNYSICDDDKITDIMCRKAGTNETAEELGQTVLCNITTGLIGLRCFNNDNLDTDAGQCEDYEVSYKCGCDIEIVTSILSSRLVGIEWSEVFRDITSWEYKEVKKYYMRITHAMMEGIDGIFSMTFVGIEPGSIIVSVEINSTRAAVNLLRYRSLELIDDFHMIPEDMANGNQSIWELMGDECTDQMDGLHEGCTPVETCFLHHHGEYRCRCHSGFIENENKTKCMDVNECEMAIDDCSVYNKTCTNTIGSFSCNCPDGLWWNTTSASCGEPPKHKWVNTRINGTSQPQQQCPDCGLGTCEYNDTNGIPFCRCPDGSTGDNCDSAVAEAGSLAALAALAAIIPCCCCLAILAARKKHKKRKLLYFIPRESLLIVAPKMTDKTTSVFDNDSAYAARLEQTPNSWSSHTDSPSFSGSDAPLFIGRYMPTPESVRRRTSNEIYRESDDESIKQYHQIFKQDRKFKLERPKFTWLPPMT